MYYGRAGYASKNQHVFASQWYPGNGGGREDDRRGIRFVRSTDAKTINFYGVLLILNIRNVTCCNAHMCDIPGDSYSHFLRYYISTLKTYSICGMYTEFD